MNAAHIMNKNMMYSTVYVNECYTLDELEYGVVLDYTTSKSKGPLSK
jgi:hypothetical protein